MRHGADVLATRLSAEQAAELLAKFPGGHYNAVGRTFRISKQHKEHKGHKEEEGEEGRGKVTIVTAGTSDLPVAEEARETALWTGAEVKLIQDVGVAGPHRLTANLPPLQEADAVVVVAGMEGALPSVVGGYVACPVIAVPTSVGYGASFGGIAALLGHVEQLRRERHGGQHRRRLQGRIRRRIDREERGPGQKQEDMRRTTETRRKDE